ncbi:hypothetical protein MD484_g8833, partial [Candolleomyces efflorescens]
MRIRIVLKRAATGSLEHLNALSWFIHDHEDYDPKICYDLVHLLDAALIPPPGTGKRNLPHEDNVHTKGAEIVLAIFLGVCEGLCKKKDSVRKSLVAHLLAQHRHHIFQWMRFFVDKGTLIEVVSCLILVISVLDRNLQEAILTSNSGVDTILAAWTQRGIGGRYEVVTEPPLCALLILFRDLVSHPGAAAVLSELLILSPLRLKKLIRALIVRVSDIRDRHVMGQVTPAFALEYIHDLLDLTRNLLHQQHISIPLFRSGELLAALPSTLLIIGGTRKGVQVWREIARCLNHLMTFCLTGGLGSINPIHQVRTVVNGGLLQVIYACLINFRPDDPTFTFVLVLLGDFAAYAVYTRVAEPFADAFTKMMAMKNIPQLLRRSGEFLALTSTITTNLSIVKSISESRVGRGLCDSSSVRKFPNDIQVLAHYKERVEGDIQQFIERPEIHLVEALFPYGGCTIRVFARLCKEDDNTFVALGAIFGLIESKETIRDGKTARQIRDYQAGELGCQ